MRIILIVDDSGDCAETLQMALDGSGGVRTAVVHSAEDALVALSTRGPVCGLITDLHLPGMQGLDLVKSVRSLPGRGNIPILVVSGDSDPRTPGRVLEAGADAFFAKPYSPAAVRRRMQELLAENRGYEHGPAA